MIPTVTDIRFCIVYPHGTHGLTVMDDEKIKYLLNTCPEIWCGLALSVETKCLNDKAIKSKGNDYRTDCGSLNLTPYLTTSCNVTVTHDENPPGLVKT